MINMTDLKVLSKQDLNEINDYIENILAVTDREDFYADYIYSYMKNIRLSAQAIKEIVKEN